LLGRELGGGGGLTSLWMAPHPQCLLFRRPHCVSHQDDYATMAALLPSASFVPVHCGFAVPFPGVDPAVCPPVRMWGAPWHFFQDWR
jgi:hypothetical protein